MSGATASQVHVVHNELLHLEKRLDKELELAVELAATVTGADPEESDAPFALIAILGLSAVGFWAIVLSWLYSAATRRLCPAMASSRAAPRKAAYNRVVNDQRPRQQVAPTVPIYRHEQGEREEGVYDDIWESRERETEGETEGETEWETERQTD
jgi:hypothetical protein